MQYKIFMRDLPEWKRAKNFHCN